MYYYYKLIKKVYEIQFIKIQFLLMKTYKLS
jgi:hypothetical protein